MKNWWSNFDKSLLAKILVILFFIALTIKPHSDSDLGWHLRYGEYFFQTGHVLKDNILTYIWSDYKWVQASWGYDLLVYQIFTHFGFLGLSVSAGAITLIIFLLVTWPIKRFGFFEFLFLATVFITQTPPLYFTGMRSQTPSSLFFAIAILIGYFSLCKPNSNSFWANKSYLFLPILFLIWANMHGGFALGLILLGALWAMCGALILFKKMTNGNFEMVAGKKWALFGLLLFISCLTPVLNPWGMRVYEETFKHSSNINLTYITEWRPLTNFGFEATFTAFVIGLALLASFFRKKIQDLPYIILLLLSAYFAYSAIRFVINLGIVLTIYFAQSLPDLSKYFKQKIVAIVSISALILYILFDIFLGHHYLIFVSPQKLVNFGWYDFCIDIFQCDTGITKVMLKNPPKGNGYNPYDYGGYLEWNVRSVKAFMDGRMAAWERPDGSTPPVATGDDVFLNNSPLPFLRFDSQYHFGWVIIPTHAYIAIYLDSLTKSGSWKILYRDKYYSYYVRSN